METLSRYLAVAVGSALGGMLRYYLGGTVLARVTTHFPLPTFVINVSGSFILGLFLTLATERLSISPHLRLAVAVGFVGAYTTFSTFEYETARLLEEGVWLAALLNIVLSVVVGFAAVTLGIIAARALVGAPPLSSAVYERFEQQADATDPAQSAGSERDIRDSIIVRRFKGDEKREDEES